jgi:L-cysteine:1D-myo-inositol 2-amino-2-deoxy-alpha-D-glucopyranoside ligase
MGHAFTYVTFDLINRTWRDLGHDVHYVQNITDIDDPLLERANALGQDWQEIAQREIALFCEDMSALRVLPPRDYIGAVEAIPSVAKHVAQLRDQGAVYEVEGDLYFRVHADPRFGQVAHLTKDEMVAIFAERGGDPQRTGKEDPLDCLVWMSARPGEPSWDTPLGAGRPGWHIECAAIALDHLGSSFDVQGGGTDLAFPHHEMSASEGQVLCQEWPFARHFVHSAMVQWQGHKMSKSRGNLVFVSQLRRQGIDPMAIRLALIAHHYRSDWAWTDQGLAGAEERLVMWRTAVSRAAASPAAGVVHKVRAALCEDLRTPEALDAIDDWCRAEGNDTGAPSEVARLVDALLGVHLT